MLIEKAARGWKVEWWTTHIARMVNEARKIATLGGVDDAVQVDAEQVRRADADHLVLRLAHVGQDRPHHLTDVLDDHLVGGDRFQREKAPVVNRRLAKLELLLAKLCPHPKVNGQSSKIGQRTKMLLGFLNATSCHPFSSQTQFETRARWFDSVPWTVHFSTHFH